MHRNGQGARQGDRLLKMQGKLDRGPVEFKSHIVQQEGEVMAIATRDVISVPPTQSIISAVATMTECGFRRLPVTDAGTKKLRGIVTSGDVINFMGGGDKYQLVRVRHNGNLCRGGKRERPHHYDRTAPDPPARCPYHRCAPDHRRQKDRGAPGYCKRRCPCRYRDRAGRATDACHRAQSALC